MSKKVLIAVHHRHPTIMRAMTKRVRRLAKVQPAVIVVKAIRALVLGKILSIVIVTTHYCTSIILV